MQPLQHLLLQPKYYDTIAEVLMQYLFQLYRIVSRESHFCPPQIIFVLKMKFSEVYIQYLFALWLSVFYSVLGSNNQHKCSNHTSASTANTVLSLKQQN